VRGDRDGLAVWMNRHDAASILGIASDKSCRPYPIMFPCPAPDVHTATTSRTDITMCAAASGLHIPRALPEETSSMAVA